MAPALPLKSRVRQVHTRAHTLDQQHTRALGPRGAWRRVRAPPETQLRSDMRMPTRARAPADDRLCAGWRRSLTSMLAYWRAGTRVYESVHARAREYFKRLVKFVSACNRLYTQTLRKVL